MRFLVDECTGSAVAKWLRGQGYEVFSVFDEARGATDKEILAKANSEDWILITNDKDFGEMIYREGHPHRGIIFLRLQSQRAATKVDVISRLLSAYAKQLPVAFVVATETQVRLSEP